MRKYLLIVFYILLVCGCSQVKDNDNKDDEIIITNFKDKNVSEVREYCSSNKIECNIVEEYSFDVSKDIVISSELVSNKLEVVVSKGSIPLSYYKENSINELGRIPIMMYHGIVDTKDNKYTGGNVDKDGYNRTSDAFRKDLEFYYQSGYRMIRLNDYINLDIDVAFGKSPIVLTFDDGNMNNFKVIDENEDGLVFDPNSAIGILEEFKSKYPDFNVTATFFLNSGLCNQKEYNEKIMKWLIDNGYDIGNHTTNHANFSNISTTKTQEVVGKMYDILNGIIPDKYVKIVALPYGSPYKKTHSNYKYILNGEYNGNKYETDGALRVGWDSEYSPFDSRFDKTFLKRCRAYDNNGKEFDIEMVFDLLSKNKYISDGNKDTVVIPKSLESNLVDSSKKVIVWED